MVSICKKLQVLLWKCMILRKRNWLLTAFELITPLLVTFFIYYIFKLSAQTKQDAFERFNSYKISEIPIFSADVAYTPIDNYIDKLMGDLYKSINKLPTESPPNMTVIGLKSEMEIEMWLQDEGIKATNKIIRPALGIVFLEANQVSKTYKYKIRTNNDKMVTEQIYTNINLDVYQNSEFLSVQNHLNIELLKHAGVQFQERYIFFGKLPVPASQEEPFPLFFLLHFFMIIAFAFLVASVVRDVLQEKATGIKELVRILGVSNWMIWVHWLIYMLMVHIPVSVIIAFILTALEPPVVPANVFIVWLLLFLFTNNCLFLLFVVTCLFNSPAVGTSVCVICWFILHIGTLKYVMVLGQLEIYKQLLLCIVPLNNLSWALYSIVSFHDYGVQWTFGQLFNEGYTGSYISVGYSIVIFILETLILLVILMYLDAVMPGPYGVAKPVNFICQWFKNIFTSVSEPIHVDSSNNTDFLPEKFEPPPTGAKVGIEIRGLNKTFGRCKKVTAVDNVNLDIYEGEIMALLGHNGAGKTTTMGMITGMFSPTRGHILADGKDIHHELSCFRESLGLCTQHNMCFSKLTLIEHLIFFGMLHGSPFSVARRNGIEILNLLNIVHKMDSKVADLSGGMKRRLCLAISLIGNPKVLILDEPTSGLDPETRHQVWDLILSMRGQRTIVITTHFMEEADVLGDRIAIMDHGQVVCCGTTMFLKKMYGTGYHIHILKELNSSQKDISSLIQKHISKLAINVVSPSQVEYVVKDNALKKFPKLFTDLNSNQSDLGITGISITRTTMEDVFLKVGKKFSNRDNIVKQRSVKRNQRPWSSTRSIAKYNKLKGIQLLCQRFKTLLWKRFIYRLRNYCSFPIKIFITSLMIMIMISDFSIHKSKRQPVQRPLVISLDIYTDSINPIIYDGDGKIIADIATKLITSQKGKVKILPNNTGIEEYMIKLAKMDFFTYSYKTLLSAELIKGNITIQYQDVRALHSPAIAANLLANIVLLNSSDNRSGSIQVINHPYVVSQEVKCSVRDMHLLNTTIPLKWLIFFTIILIIIMLDFILFLTEERVSGFKHQQLMTGVSPLLYLVTNFIYDFFMYLFVIAVWIIIFFVFGRETVFLNYYLLLLLIMVLLLYGISGLLFTYLFSFLIDNAVMCISMFLMFNIAFGMFPALLIYSGIITDFEIFQLVTSLFSLNPIYAASISIAHIARATATNYLCISCGNEQSCKQRKESLLIMPTKIDRSGILIYVHILALSSIIYFILILLIDYRIIKRLSQLFCLKTLISSGPPMQDEDVEIETELVTFLKESGDVSLPLRVDHLVKKYKSGLIAVNNVSFVLNYGECFGLLGVNGAGKTTTFKILTGEISPNSGDAVIFDTSVIHNRRKYLSHVGYCPQFDAILNTLTGEEILKIIGKLRGISQNEIKTQVKTWLDMMGISELARKQCGTYSGGTKRKLSTAMAFIGEQEVVFLDEPTTGVDPMSRRKLWGVVQMQQRAGQAIVLTSHSMEECEALCTRLTIMKDGQMQCIGSTEYLKKKFGQGYTVLIKLSNPSDDEVNKLKEEFSRVFPESVIKDDHVTMIHYHILDPQIPLSKLFSDMLSIKKKFDIIEDFSASNTTLEELFLSFAHD